MKGRLLDSLKATRNFKKFHFTLLFTGFVLLFSTAVAFAQAASATWAGTASVNSAVAGNVTAPSATNAGVNAIGFGSNGLTSTGWPTDNNRQTSDYYQFQVTPTAGNTFLFNGISFNYSVPVTGSWGGAVYYSINNTFGAGTQLGADFTPTASTTAVFNNSPSVLVPAGSTLTVRVYGWDAPFTTSNRVFRIKNMVISGITCGTLAITTQPAGQTVCAGSTLSLTCAANNAVSYQWRKDNVNIGGATSATYSKPNITAADAGSYTVIATNACGSQTSNAAVIAVNPSPTSVTATAEMTTVCAGQQINLTATATTNSETAVTLLAQNFNAPTNNWTTTNTSTGGTPANAAWTLRNDYEPPGFSGTVDSNDSSQFYFSNSNSQGGGTTRTTLVSPAFSTVGLSSASISFYHYFRFNSAGDVGSIEVSTNGTTWSSVASYTSTQGVAQNFANANVSLASVLNQPTVYVRFNYNASNGRYWAVDNVVISGNYINGPATYAWTSVPAGFTSNLQNPAVIPTANTTYTVAVTNTYGCTVSASTSLVTVNPASVGGTVAGSTAVCSGSNSGSLTLSGHIGAVTGWESSTNNFATAGTPIANTTTTLNYTNLTTATQFRAIVKSGVCSSAYSSIATIGITSLPVGGTVATSATVCYGNNSGTLTLSGHTGTVTGWESSFDNFATAGTPIANTTASQSYTNLTATTSYRAIIANGCGTVYSSPATMTVDFATAWTGTNGTSWHDAGNWVCGVVPTSVLNVTIPATANQPVISADAQANTLTLQTGATLTLESDNNLSVVGVIDVQGTANFTVENNANLVQVNDVANTGSITVKRNSSALKRQDYTLWSSPVAVQNLLAFSPQTLTNRFYTYNPASNQFNTIASPASTTFNEAQGYLIRMPNNHPTTATVWNGQFTGVPNNGDATFTLSNGGAGLRFNLIGNPYPSAIDMETFVSDNSANITGTLYFWRKTNNAANPSYCSWTSGGGFVDNGEDQVFDPNGTLRTGQGFIVEASALGTSVTFNNAQRVGNNANQFFRSANEIERNRIWLNATGATGAFSQTLVGYITGSTLEVDDTIDGRFFNDGEISFYSLIGDERMVIQGRPLPFASSDVVPMGFKASTAGNYTISIDHVDGLFADDQDIFLRDNAANVVHDLKSGAYDFACEAGTFNERFEVIYQNALSVGDPVLDPNAVIVYKDKSGFVVNSGAMDMASIKVYDVRGRLVREISDINSSEARFDISGSNQVLIFKIRSTEGQETNKKVLN